jgi:hypothetical protein
MSVIPKAKAEISSLGTVGAFLKKGTCSQTLFSVLNVAFDHPLISEERASDPLAGGIAQNGYQCGQLWGATLAAGVQAYHLWGAGPKAETMAITAAHRLVKSFRTGNGSINCLELTGLDLKTNKQIIKFLATGGPVRCFSMAARFASQALHEINAAYADKALEPPAPPVSCAALVAHKLGVSDRHSAMTAGFAGGIGLSGGACGALGAAIWLRGMKTPGEKVKYKEANTQAENVIESFLKITDNRFLCSEIVGRTFNDVGEHAAYLRDGGCAKIILALVP